jgi:hypothetical protein
MYISQGIKDEYNQPESTVGDYANIMNPLGLRINSPELYSAKGYERDINFDSWAAPEELFEGLDSEVVYDIKDSAVSEDHLHALIGRNQQYKESIERISKDPLYTQLTLGLMTGIADPFVLVPVGGALNKVNSAVKGANMFSKVGAKAATVGTVGAASAVGSESLMDVQGLPTHYLNATLYGMALGGGLSVIGDAISHAARPAKAIESFKKDPLSETLPLSAAQIVENSKVNKAGIHTLDDTGIVNTVDEVIGNVTGTMSTRGGIVPRVKSILGNTLNFASSSESKVLSSASDSVRTIGAYIKRPFTSKDYVVQKSANDIKAKVEGWHQTALQEVYGIWNNLKKTGFKQNFEEFADSLGSSFIGKAAQQRKMVYSSPIYKQSVTELDTAITKITEDRTKFKDMAKQNNLGKEEIKVAEAKFDEALEAAKQNHYQKIESLWEDSYNKIDLNEAERHLADYYKAMLQASKTSGIDEFKYVSDFALYGGERRIDSAKVKAMDEAEAKAMIREAMLADPRNDLKPGVLTRKVNKFYEYAITENVTRDGADTLIGNISGNVGRMAKRKFNLDDSLILPMLQTSASQAVSRYSSGMAGQIALRQMFPELRGVAMEKTTKAFQKQIGKPLLKQVTKELGDAKLAQKELAELSYMIEDILNNVNLKSHSNSLPWRAQRTLNSVASLQLGAGMGIYNLFEVPTVALATGFHKMFGKELTRGFAEVSKHIYANKGSDVTKHLVGIGRLMSTMHTSHMNRFTDSTLMFTRQGSEGILQKGNDVLFKYTGMHLFQSMNEMHTAVRMADLIYNYKPNKYNKAKMNALMRGGLDEPTIFKLQESMRRNKVFDEKGYLTKLDIDEELQSTLDTAILNSIDDAVIQAGVDNVPRWMLELGPMGKLMTQFWSFGFKAREKLLVKGMNENPAGLAAATLASTGLAMSYFYAIEQAEIATGGKSWTDAEYDMSTEDGFTNLLQKGLMYSGPLAFPSFMYGLANKAVVFGGGEGLPGAGYADKDLGSFLLGPTYGNAQALAELSVMISQGDLSTPEAKAAAYQLSVLKTVPVLSNAMENLLKD